MNTATLSNNRKITMHQWIIVNRNNPMDIYFRSTRSGARALKVLLSDKDNQYSTPRRVRVEIR